MEIAGKKAVIVGGASGMARASAKLLRERGASVAILDLPKSAGAEAAKELDGTFHPVDITDEAAAESALADAVAALGGLHIAVNTAGGGGAPLPPTKRGPAPPGCLPPRHRAEPDRDVQPEPPASAAYVGQ